VDEVCEHAESWDQSDDLHESPEGEEDSEKHLGGLFCLRKFLFCSCVVLMDEAGSPSMKLCDS